MLNYQIAPIALFLRLLLVSFQLTISSLHHFETQILKFNKIKLHDKVIAIQWSGLTDDPLISITILS